MTYKYNVGGYTSEDQEALRRDVLAEMVWLKTKDKIEFGDAVVMKDTDVLDKHLRFPKDHTLPTFQISERSSSEPQTMGWFEKSFSLNKYRSKLVIDDESKIRLDEATQMEYSMEGVARGMAQARDYEILESLINGAGIDIDAGVPWNNDNSDLVADVANMIGKIFEKDETNVSESDINSIVIYYPLKLWGHIRTPEMLVNPTGGGNMGRLMVDTSAYGWAGGEYGIYFKGTTKLNKLNMALGVIRNDQTAAHFTYTGGKIPTVEQIRDAEIGADAWMVTQYYKTFVYPQSFEQQNSNDRIMLIKDVSTSPVTP